MRKSTSHIVLDANKQQLRCNACGKWSHTNTITGVQFADAHKIINRFLQRHELCHITHNYTEQKNEMSVGLKKKRVSYESERVNKIINKSS